MKERDRLVIKQWEAEQREAAEREREAAERPIREAQEKLARTHAELAKVYISRLRGEVPDPDKFISPEVATVRMKKSDVPNYVLKQWQLFVTGHPNLYLCPELVDLFERYFERNKLPIVTAEMFSRLCDRFAEYGLLPERPAPAPEPDQEPILEQTPAIQEPELVDGWDLQSGEPRQYTQRELDRLSSTDYRRALRLYRDAFQLPTRGPGPIGNMQ